MTRWNPWPVLALALALGPASGAAEDRALVIAINEYPDKPLLGPLNDARTMERLLTGPLGFRPDQVRMLLDGAATRQGIIDAVETWIIAGTGPGDRALIYWSGHGTQLLERGEADEADGLDEALVPVDYKGPAGGLLIDDEIAAFLETLADRRVTLIVDACNSGTISRTLAGDGSGPPRTRYLPTDTLDVPRAGGTRSARAQDMRDDDGVADTPRSATLEVWSASAPYQLAWETRIDGRPQGVFTEAFARAVQGAADRNGNGTVSRNEVMHMVRAESRAFCSHDPECREGELSPELEAEPRIRALEVAQWTGDVAPSPGELAEDLFLPPVSGMNLAILGMDGEVRPVRAGDLFRLELNAPIPGRLVLLDLRDDGAVTLLFPSALLGDDRTFTVRRNVAHRLPFNTRDVRLRMQPGTGRLMALVVSDPVALDDLVDAAMALAPTPDPESFLAALSERLGVIWTHDEENRTIEWTAGFAEYGG